MTLTAIDLFCGAGGLSAGLEMAGFRVLAGVDLFEAAGKTFEDTHPEARFIGKPIEDVTIEELVETTGVQPGKLTVLAGGPPCQAYSVYNHQRGMHDERAVLFKQYLRIVEGMQPEWIVMENVMGIYSIGGGEAVRAIKAELRKLGYEVEEKVLKAEEFGVPQERRRVVFIGNRIGAPIRHPEPTHGEGLEPFTTIKDAIGDLVAIENGEDRGPVGYAKPAWGDFQKYARSKASRTVHNHSAPKLGKINVERMAHIPPGGSWRDIPFDLLPAGMKRAKRSDHTKRYGRMTWNGLSCTVLTKCDVHWGAYIHPEQDRAISVREAARLQAFPDWFEFSGSRTDQYVQVGNAVPPLLGRAIGKTIRQLIEESSRSKIAAE
ncbi:DNA cytosine methyltransferase [Tritonibacter mobilis]|uniref:DNA cytosine methyltransferase n=1 Tax=Tritonibacter mobilis TaxID=379347 RepID=UPI001C098F1A|nr:DNA cytosine methyltransferase [Tritonibacter mobilis]MBU3032669.1 DNA cytosine methyltransferase [Tritonibacter mobilis]WHQ81867.1 DNA cytosine methyltransferase [Tritonibacter mobilis]